MLMWQGRVVEIFGQEASGKTTLALHVIAEAQKIGKGSWGCFPFCMRWLLGCIFLFFVPVSVPLTPACSWRLTTFRLCLNSGHCLFVDAEHALDMQFAEGIGVRTRDLLFVQPDYAEQALDTVDHFVRSTGVDVIVVDSVMPGFPGFLLANYIRWDCCFSSSFSFVSSVGFYWGSTCLVLEKRFL
jgi:recombination protein RecA